MDVERVLPNIPHLRGKVSQVDLTLWLSLGLRLTLRGHHVGKVEAALAIAALIVLQQAGLLHHLQKLLLLRLIITAIRLLGRLLRLGQSETSEPLLIELLRLL